MQTVESACAHTERQAISDINYLNFNIYYERIREHIFFVSVCFKD